jgi:hypothetical protein
MDFEPHSISDCHQCPACRQAVALHDKYCRGCGVLFTPDHVAEMKKHFHLPLNVSPWNVRDRFKCIYCAAAASVHDAFCRMCGKKYGAQEIAIMRDNMSKLARIERPVRCRGSGSGSAVYSVSYGIRVVHQ